MFGIYRYHLSVQNGSGTDLAWVSLYTLPVKNFPAFLFPDFSIFGMAEIHAEEFGNVFKRQVGTVRLRSR